MKIYEKKSKASTNIFRTVLEQLQYFESLTFLDLFAPTHSEVEAICENMQDMSSARSSL